MAESIRAQADILQKILARKQQEIAARQAQQEGKGVLGTVGRVDALGVGQDHVALDECGVELRFHARALCHPHVVFGVSDDQGVGGSGIEIRQDFLEHLRVRFRERLIGTARRVKKIAQPTLLQRLIESAAALAGGHTQQVPALMKTADQFVRAVEHHGLFDLGSNPVLDTWLAPSLVLESLDAVLIVSFFNIVKMLAGNAIDAAGLRNVLEIFCEFQYAQFTFCDFLLGGHVYLLF